MRVLICLPYGVINRGYYMVARRYEFYFRVAKQYFTNGRSEWVKHCFCHEKIKFMSSSRRVMFFLYMLMTAFLMIFRRFPTTLRRFPKIFQNCSEGQTNFPEHFPKISEDVRRLPKTLEEDPKMFRWYTNEFKYNLRDTQKQKAGIVTSLNVIARHWTIRHSQRWHTENTPLGSRMKWRMESTSGLVSSKTLVSI